MKTLMVTTLIAAFHLLTGVLLILGAPANAKNLSKDLSKDFHFTDEGRRPLTIKEVRERFQLSAQNVVSDSNGKLLYFGNDMRTYKFDSKGDLTIFSMSKEPGIKDIALRMDWKMKDDGEITLHLEQYESMDNDPKGGDDPKLGKLVRKGDFKIKDFAPIDWLAWDEGGRRVIVRLTPLLGDHEEAVDADTAPVVLDSAVVFDNKGFFWARTDSGLEGRYISIKTHMGAFALSFAPFKGAKEVGYAKGSQITINAGGDLRIFVRSSAPILAMSRPAKVYGIVDLEKRTQRPMSVHAQSGDKEKEFLRDF